MGQLKNMNKKTVIQVLLIVVITAAFIFYIKKNGHAIKEALAFKFSFLISLIVLNLLNKVCLGLKTRNILKLFSINLSFVEWFGLSVVNNFYNYLAPKSGTAVVGIYLKNKHKLDYNKYLAVLITTGLITIFTSGIIGTVISIFFFPGKLFGMITFLMLFLGMILGTMIIFWISRFKFSGKGIFEKINKFLEGWRVLHKNFNTILFLAIMDVCTVSLMAMRYLILFNIFSVPVGFVSCVLIAPFNIITHFATFIPGAYGIKEAAVGAASALTGIPFASGALATLSDRVIMMALTFVLGPIFSFILLKHGFKGKSEGKTA